MVTDQQTNKRIRTGSSGEVPELMSHSRPLPLESIKTLRTDPQAMKDEHGFKVFTALVASSSLIGNQHLPVSGLVAEGAKLIVTDKDEVQVSFFRTKQYVKEPKSVMLYRAVAETLDKGAGSFVMGEKSTLIVPKYDVFDEEVMMFRSVKKIATAREAHWVEVEKWTDEFLKLKPTIDEVYMFNSKCLIMLSALNTGRDVLLESLRACRENGFEDKDTYSTLQPFTVLHSAFRAVQWRGYSDDQLLETLKNSDSNRVTAVLEMTGRYHLPANTSKMMYAWDERAEHPADVKEYQDVLDSDYILVNTRSASANQIKNGVFASTKVVCAESPQNYIFRASTKSKGKRYIESTALLVKKSYFERVARILDASPSTVHGSVMPREEGELSTFVEVEDPIFAPPK